MITRCGHDFVFRRFDAKIILWAVEASRSLKAIGTGSHAQNRA